MKKRLQPQYPSVAYVPDRSSIFAGVCFVIFSLGFARTARTVRTYVDCRGVLARGLGAATPKVSRVTTTSQLERRRISTFLHRGKDVW